MKILFVSISKLAVYLDGKAPSELLSYKVNCSAAAKSSASAELMLFMSSACVSISGSKLLWSFACEDDAEHTRFNSVKCFLLFFPTISLSLSLFFFFFFGIRHKRRLQIRLNFKQKLMLFSFGFNHPLCLRSLVEANAAQRGPQ